MTDRGRPLRIGITGPIGCGKSTVAHWLGEHPGVVVVDADRVARDVLDVGTGELEAVYRRFGGALRGADGALDRAALGRIVFADPDALGDLESIVHPAVRPRILAAIADADANDATAVVIEAIKLVEGGLADLCDEVWLVACRSDVQRGRLLGRGSSAEDAAARIAAQGDLVARLTSRATRVLATDDPQAAVRDVVERTLADALAGRSGARSD